MKKMNTRMVALFAILSAVVGVIVDAQSATVSLGWDANTDGVTKGYYVYTLQGTTQVSKQDALTATTFTVSGLANSTTYSFNVTAYDVNKRESLPSNTVNFTTPAAIPIPAVPTISGYNWSKNAVSGYDIDVAWTVSAGATSYVIQILNASGAVLQTNTSTSNATRFAAMPAGAYSVMVKASNTSGSSVFSGAYAVIILASPGNTRVITSTP